MASDKNNQYLVTGDVDGIVKVWEIVEYATHSVTDLIKDPPPLRTQFQPHTDMINTMELCERNERLIIVTASSDCSVALWDVHGNRLGTFGQEEHWKIEPYNQLEIEEDQEPEEEEEVDDQTECDSDEDSEWAPDPKAVDNPAEYRMNTWDSTVLGNNYKEARVRKRQRRQPGTIPDLAYLHWETTGQPPAGPYSALDINALSEFDLPSKPDPDKYFFERPFSQDKRLPKLPALADTLKTAYDEKSLFPPYIREFEMKMKNYHTQALASNQPKQSIAGPLKTRPSLQNIGQQLGAQMTKGSAKTVRQRGLPGLRLKPLPQSRRSSVTTES